ncbi:MAG: hypothetical protein VXX91_01655, partial [Planctomycetota bacterium]|nr:hypothetical protein [Planctomycetota bacterium]
PSRCVRLHGFCLGICVSLLISLWWYGADKKRFLPQHERLSIYHSIVFSACQIFHRFDMQMNR